MTAKAEASNAERSETSDVAVTSTALLVQGRILFLYCAAQAQDAAWTREVSRLWADAIVEHNPH